jgi:ubiquinone biosynthesis accessory factor UbiJ
MTSHSPFAALAAALPRPEQIQALARSLRPPAWVVDETQNKLVLCINHVLLQEAAAQDRLRHQQGKVIRMTWDAFHCTLKITPAGLFEVSNTLDSSTPDLVIAIESASALDLVKTLAQGQKPKLSIHGDVQLAAEVAWMKDHVRWDAAEDLSKLMGDVASHGLMQGVERVSQGVQSLLNKGNPSCFNREQHKAHS